MRIYYHCDDAGATPSISRRILEGWREGWLDGFSLFANCQHMELFQAELASHPQRELRLGVHLNLSEGLPVAHCPSLLSSTGELHSSFLGLLAGRAQACRGEILDEWREQLRRVQQALAPRRVVVLDSHNHVHMIPCLFPLACQVAREMGVPEVRWVREPLYLSADQSECLTLQFLLNLAKCGIIWACRRRPVGVGHPDGMLGLLFSGRISAANLEAGIARARGLGYRSLEVLTHVGRAAPDELDRWGGDVRRAAFFVSPWRDREWEELRRWRARS